MYFLQKIFLYNPRDKIIVIGNNIELMNCCCQHSIKNSHRRERKKIPGNAALYRGITGLKNKLISRDKNSSGLLKKFQVLYKIINCTEIIYEFYSIYSLKNVQYIYISVCIYC